MDILKLNWQEVHQVKCSPLQEMFQKYRTLFTEGIGTWKNYKAKILVDRSVPPRFCRARSVPYAMRALVEEELDNLLKEGVISLVQYADWAAPIVPILKRDRKSVRICGDFKLTVNQASKLDRYPIPKIEDLFAKVNGGKVFTQLDLSQAYQQLLLEEESKQYVVINTQRGLFRYNRLPFGVSSAPGIFQRAMESLLQGIPNIAIYLDDILISGTSEEEHLKTLEIVPGRLQDAGLKLKRDKCLFMRSSVVYLGYLIDADGLHPMPDKVKAILEAPEPTNVTELKSYLGLLNYYGKFLQNVSSILHPLYSLLQKSATWKWSQGQREAFRASKKLMISSQMLVHFDPEKELILSCDASQYGIGAVLADRMADGTEKFQNSHRCGKELFPN